MTVRAARHRHGGLHPCQASLSVKHVVNQCLEFVPFLCFLIEPGGGRENERAGKGVGGGSGGGGLMRGGL